VTAVDCRCANTAIEAAQQWTIPIILQQFIPPHTASAPLWPIRTTDHEETTASSSVAAPAIAIADCRTIGESVAVSFSKSGVCSAHHTTMAMVNSANQKTSCPTQRGVLAQDLTAHHMLSEPLPGRRSYRDRDQGAGS
jgi:hypothetical protein